MHTRAAIMTEPGADWAIEQLDLDTPRVGEVLVRFTHAGLCYSDEHVRHGTMAELPVIGGHEGAGIVQAVGPGVDRLAPGDHVAASFVPSCGHCRWCASGRANLCDRASTGSRNAMPDGTFRFTDGNGVKIGSNCGLGTFAEHAVVAQDSLVKVHPGIPLSVVALVSCGVLTGWGAAAYSAGIRPGDTVLVIGAGGVGINAIQGAHYVGAGTVVVAEPNLAKHHLAVDLGADDVVPSINDAAELARQINPSAQGADVTIVCTPNTTAEIITSAFEATGKGGTIVMAGMSEDVHDVNIKLPGTQLIFAEKRIQGSIFGSCNPTRDLPLILSLYRQGRIKLDELVSRTYPLDQIETGFADLRAGRNIRGLIEHRPDTDGRSENAA